MSRLIDLGVADWVEAGRSTVSPLQDSNSVVPASCPSYPPAGNGQAFAYRNLHGELVFCDVTEVPLFPMRESVRLFGPCVASRCAHWSTHCNLGAALSRAVVRSEGQLLIGDEPYLSCRIQDTCRWKWENGIAACRACVSVDYFIPS